LVKTQDLQKEFPNVVQGPNVLYLISSALPAYAPRMARWAKKAGAKIVLNQNGVAYPAWHKDGWEKTNKFMRDVLVEADHVFYQSSFCKLAADKYLSERSHGYDVLYNPVDTKNFHPPVVQVSPFQVRLLLAGSHTHFYRVQTAVDTLDVLKAGCVDATLEIAGRCCWAQTIRESESQLYAYIQQRGLLCNVTMSGPYTQEQAKGMFQRAHILLHTKYNDPCPRLVVEAMASGLPVVYSASGGTPELVGEEAGIGVSAPLDWDQDHPPAPEKMAAAIIEIRRKWEVYSRKARERVVSLFDVKPWIERHRQVFESLCKKAPSKRESKLQ